MSVTRAYAAQSAAAPLAPFQFQRRELRPDDVAIEVLYCGICHTDIHYVRNDWGRSRYPMVPGHEIVGRVTAVGPEVKDFKAGDLAGVGCMVDSCQRCESCAVGLEQYCVEGATFTYNGIDRQDKSNTLGGYSERIVVSRKFVLRVPEKLDLKGRRRCSAPASPPTRRCATGRPARASAWRSWGSAASATWP